MINDTDGNAATLTLASPGASGSFDAKKGLMIEGLLPAPTGLVMTPGMSKCTYLDSQQLKRFSQLQGLWWNQF